MQVITSWHATKDYTVYYVEYNGGVQKRKSIRVSRGGGSSEIQGRGRNHFVSYTRRIHWCGNIPNLFESIFN